MPVDHFAKFPANLSISDTEIVFPNKYVMEWNTETDWFSVFNNDFILVTHCKYNLYAKIGSIDTPDKLQVNYHLHSISNQTAVVRGWLMANCFLISPAPKVDECCLTIKYSRTSPDTFYSANFCLPGTWVTHIIVDETGKYFALYDFEDDYTLVMNHNFIICYSIRCASYPTALTWTDNKLMLTQSNRWTNEHTTVEVNTMKV